MSRTMQQRLPGVEVKTSHDRDEHDHDRVKRLHSVPLRQAKAGMGAAIRAAIGEHPMKAFGHEGLISEVCSGERIPEYLAKLYDDPAARRRLAAALLEGDPRVRSYRVFEIAED